MLLFIKEWLDLSFNCELGSFPNPNATLSCLLFLLEQCPRMKWGGGALYWMLCEYKCHLLTDKRGEGCGKGSVLCAVSESFFPSSARKIRGQVFLRPNLKVRPTRRTAPSEKLFTHDGKDLSQGQLTQAGSVPNLSWDEPHPSWTCLFLWLNHKPNPDVDT